MIYFKIVKYVRVFWHFAAVDECNFPYKNVDYGFNDFFFRGWCLMFGFRVLHHTRTFLWGLHQSQFAIEPSRNNNFGKNLTPMSLMIWWYLCTCLNFLSLDFQATIFWLGFLLLRLESLPRSGRNTLLRISIDLLRRIRSIFPGWGTSRNIIIHSRACFRGGNNPARVGGKSAEFEW